MFEKYSFLFGFIYSIGFYRIFFSINRPESKRCSIALILICIFYMPAFYFWKDFCMRFGSLPSHYFLISLFLEILVLLAVILLSVHRRRAIICALYTFTVKGVLELPILLLICAVARPSKSMLESMDDLIQIPWFYYISLSVHAITVMSCCFLAAYWLRKTILKTPLKLVILFSLIFAAIYVILSIWIRDMVSRITASFFPSSLPAITLVVMIPVVFYIFTRLTTVKKNVNSGKNEIQYTQYAQQLSKRELEVIEAVLAGYNSQKELAETLNISTNTVKTHLKHIYQATGVSGIDALSLLFKGYTPAHPKITPKSP